MENIYDLLDNIRALYSDSNLHITSLARVCQALQSCIEEETNKYPEIYSLYLKYIILMHAIAYEETNKKVQKMMYENLFKLSKLL